MHEYLLLVLVVAFAGFVQGFSGFGSIMIALPLLSQFIDIKTIIPLVALFALYINGSLILQLHNHCRWKRYVPMLVATLPGIPLGVYILKTVPVSVLTLMTGIIIFLFSLYSLFASTPTRRLGNFWAAVAGFTAGCLGGSIGANGPPIIIYTSLQPWTKDEIKANMVIYFLIAGVFISSMHATAGLITLNVLTYFAIGFPVLALSVFVGARCYKRLTDRNYRQLINILILALGVLMVIRGLD